MLLGQKQTRVVRIYSLDVDMFVEETYIRLR